MTGIIADTGEFIAVITIPQLNNRFENQKGGTGRFPLFSICCVVSEAR